MPETDVLVVECHSGVEYPERPKAIRLGSRFAIVKRLLSEARSPTGKTFLAEMETGECYRLTFHQRDGVWTAESEPPSNRHQ